MTAQTSIRVLITLLLLAFNGFASPVKQRGNVPLSAGIFGAADRYFPEFSDVRKLFSNGVLNPADGRRREIRDRLDTFNVPTEVMDQDWDVAGDAWTNALDVMISYDTLGRETERTVNFGFMTFWMPQANHQRTYDAYGRLSRIITRTWTGTAWQITSRDTLLYNLSGLPVEERVDTYNGSGWDPDQRYLVSYDPGHRPVEVIGQDWVASAYNNAFRYAVTYDSAGQDVEFLNQTWNGSGWGNNLRIDYSWDVNGNRTVELDQFWSSGAWNDDERYTWTYDASNYVIETIFDQWSGSAWVNDTREAYTNNAEGYPEETLRQYWDGTGWADDKVTYSTYDGPTVVEALTMTWTGSTWINYHKASYAWQQFIKSAEVTQQYAVTDQWNMVSVPLDVADDARTAIFPTSVSNAFAFNAGYSPAVTLEPGRGYWLKFSGAQSVAVTGLPILDDTIDVAAGWNMVGSIGLPVAAASVGSIPGGIVSSNFFAFNNGYSNAATIEPGKGYWVKVAQAGQLVLSASGNVPVASLLRMELHGELPPAPPVDGDAAGSSPVAYALQQNYPNPFNPVTTIRYSLPSDGRVVVSVFNMIGQEVARLVDGMQSGGEQAVSFDAAALPSGVYTYRITAGTFTDSKKMLLVK
jgi:hypothetical protein